jgi:Glycosyltransferase 61
MQKPVSDEILRLLKLDSKFEIYIKGFGNKKLAKDALFVSKNFLPICKFRHSILLANFFHAYAELQSENSTYIWPSTNQKLRKLLVRSISIGLYNKRVFDGVHNGFSLSFIASLESLQEVPKITLPLGRARYARATAHIGCVIPNLESNLENEIRRNDYAYDVQFLSCYLTPYGKNWIARSFLRRFFPLFLNEIVLTNDKDLAVFVASALPNWHYARAFFTLHFNENIFGATNIYKKAKLIKNDNSFEFSPESLDKRVLWSRIEKPHDFTIGTYRCEDVKIVDARHVILEGYLLPDDTRLSQQLESFSGWPISIWSKKGADFVAVPNSIIEYESSSRDLILPSNTNWEHFVEEVLPRLVVAELELEFDRIVISGIYDDSQLQAMQAFSEREISVYERSNSYSCKALSCTVQDGRRHLAIRNQLNKLSLLDQEAMYLIRSKASKLLIEMPSIATPDRIYVQRRLGLFRRLLNQESIELILEEFDFQFVRTEDLSFSERIRLFGQAKIIVLESGAGMGNLHFCGPNTIVLELRHPGLKNSTEETAFNPVGITMNRVVGENASFFQRLVFGTDSYKVNHKLFTNVLRKLFAEIKT